MGRLLDGLKDAEYNPHTAVCKLPQPFRMLDKLLSRLVDDAVNLAVERDEARLAARGIAEGTEVLAPSAVVDDIGAVTSVSTSRDGAWAFVGNEDGELVVVNVERGSVASKTKVLAGSIAAVDAVAVDPPPPPPPRPPTPPPEETTETEGENEGAEGGTGGEEAEPKDDDAEPKDDARDRGRRRRRDRRAVLRRHRRRRGWTLPGRRRATLPRRARGYKRRDHGRRRRLFNRMYQIGQYNGGRRR